jgi:hypothetical protein
MGMLRHRPQESNAAVVSLLQNKNVGEKHVDELFSSPINTDDSDE